MKNKIIEILNSETFNTSDEAGNNYIVISSDYFDDLADRIVKLFAKSDVSVPVCNICDTPYYYNNINKRFEKNCDC